MTPTQKTITLNITAICAGIALIAWAIAFGNAAESQAEIEHARLGQIHIQDGWVKQ